MQYDEDASYGAKKKIATPGFDPGTSGCHVTCDMSPARFRCVKLLQCNEFCVILALLLATSSNWILVDLACKDDIDFVPQNTSIIAQPFIGRTYSAERAARCGDVCTLRVFHFSRVGRVFALAGRKGRKCSSYPRREL